jgi:hypothetical protein
MSVRMFFIKTKETKQKTSVREDVKKLKPFYTCKYISKRIKSGFQRDICTLFIATSFTIAYNMESTQIFNKR